MERPRTRMQNVLTLLLVMTGPNRWKRAGHGGR